jgi:hypothetical protein
VTRLTPEQVAEGVALNRRDAELLAGMRGRELRHDGTTLSGGKFGSRLQVEDWLWENREALLEAAALVARREAEELAQLKASEHAAATPVMTPARAVEIATRTLESLVGHPDVRNEYFSVARALRELLVNQ